jgi:hypothetical protein
LFLRLCLFSYLFLPPPPLSVYVDISLMPMYVIQVTRKIGGPNVNLNI